MSSYLFFSITEKIAFTWPVHNQVPKQNVVTEDIKPDKNETYYSSFLGLTSPATLQQRSKALTTIEMLNCVQQLLENKALQRGHGDKIFLAIREAKRALMLSVWDEDDWGPVDQLGVAGPSDDAPLQLRIIFNSTYENCQK
ncbi:MAG: hypothetical protein GY874_18460 [Desulfobacteraceae bacterium]|nr:hypothetical protein [Desulfobacteraceae bacterium]